MNKNKWIMIAVVAVVTILALGGLVWFIKANALVGGVYYLLSVIAGFCAGWFLKGKWDAHKKEKLLLKD